MKHIFYLMISGLCMSTALKAQEVIKLYPAGPTESNFITEKESMLNGDFVINISNPRMFVYQPAREKNNGTSVLICPGGGYAGVSAVKEGAEIAKWFNQQGITAFVLYYRMPNGHMEIPLKDARVAFKIIYDYAAKWALDKKKIGIMGFSAGGHLASTVGTHFTSDADRPAFMILAYPVVTMNTGFTHIGSRENLLGKTPTDETVLLYSNESQVTINTPATFVFHAIDDDVVPIANSEHLLKALLDKNVPAELHKFDVGGHGFGIRKRGLPADSWPDLLKIWLHANKLI